MQTFLFHENIGSWSGRLVPPRDAEALARPLLDSLENSRTAREMVTRAREFVGRRFTAQRLLSHMTHFYSPLLAKKAINVPMKGTLSGLQRT